MNGIDEKYLLYLDALRESGITNMFGASPYLMNAFPELSKSESREVLSHWMKTFGERHKSKIRMRAKVCACGCTNSPDSLKCDDCGADLEFDRMVEERI